MIVRRFQRSAVRRPEAGTRRWRLAWLWGVFCLLAVTGPVQAEEGVGRAPPMAVGMAASAPAGIARATPAGLGSALGFSGNDVLAASALGEQRGGTAGGALPMLPAGASPGVILWDELRAGQRRQGTTAGGSEAAVRIIIQPQ